MPARRNNIERYWKKAELAPEGVTAHVVVTDGGNSEYLLPYPCKLTADGWVHAASGKPLAVLPKYWKPYVKTLPKKAPGRKKANRSGA